MLTNHPPRRTSARLANAPSASAAPPSPDDESVRLEDVLSRRPRRAPPSGAPAPRDDVRATSSSSRAPVHTRTRAPPAPAPGAASARVTAPRQPSQSKRKRAAAPPAPEAAPARKTPRSRKSHVVGGFRFHPEDEDEDEDEGPQPVPSTPPRRARTQSRFEPLPADLMGETPIARRNQAARRGDAIGLGLPSYAGKDGRRRTRSSLSGKAARRVSSLRNGSIAFPHPSVPDEHLHRHCADTLDPVGRMTYLLAWCAERARPPEAKARTEQDRRLQQTIAQTLADLDSHELSLSWLSRPGRREELAAQRASRAANTGLAPHPRNVANADRVAELEGAEARIATEVQGWQDASQRVDACERRTGLLAEALERVWPADQGPEWHSDVDSEEEDETTAETWATLEAFANQTRTRPDEDLPEMAHPPGRDVTPTVDAGEEDAALRAAAGRALAWAQRDSVPLPPAWRALASDAATELETAPPSHPRKGKARQSGPPSAHNLADPDEARTWILSDQGTSRDPRWTEMESQVDMLRQEAHKLSSLARLVQQYTQASSSRATHVLRDQVDQGSSTHLRPIEPDEEGPSAPAVGSSAATLLSTITASLPRAAGEAAEQDETDPGDLLRALARTGRHQRDRGHSPSARAQ